MITREQIEEIQTESREKGVSVKKLLGCWAHARRKFFEARKENEKLANEALFYIGKLYDVEREADEMDEADEKPNYERRKSLRQEKAYPEIRKFETWLEDVLRRMPEYELGKKDCSDLLPGN